MFCLHIYFNFLLKASWTHNLFYFLSILKSLQVKIQAYFSSQALPISFIQHSTNLSNYWLKNNYESSKTLITSNYALLFFFFFFFFGGGGGGGVGGGGVLFVFSKNPF